MFENFLLHIAQKQQAHTKIYKHGERVFEEGDDLGNKNMLFKKVYSNSFCINTFSIKSTIAFLRRIKSVALYAYLLVFSHHRKGVFCLVILKLHLNGNPYLLLEKKNFCCICFQCLFLTNFCVFGKNGKIPTSFFEFVP